MDKFFDNFYNYKGFGPPMARQDVPEASVRAYRGRLPEQLLAYWQEYGWCGYAHGLYWTVNPAEWEEPMRLMLDGTGFLERDAYHVIARNAFGDLWLWGETTGQSLRIRSADGMIYPHFDDESFREDGPDLSIRLFFSTQSKGAVDLLDDEQQPLFERALHKLGPLTAAEVYGFVPLPALGGACTLAHLHKLEAAVYMEMLAEMTPMRVMPDYTAMAKSQGLL
jgi:hypothetical protein